MAGEGSQRTGGGYLLIREDSSPAHLPIENYLKMTRFNITDSEILEKCLISADDSNSPYSLPVLTAEFNAINVTNSNPVDKQTEAINVDHLEELDDEQLLQVSLALSLQI